MSASDPTPEQYEECSAPGCRAARLQAERCLVHVSDEEFAIAIGRSLQGEGLDVRGARLDSALLDRLLDALTGEPSLPSLPDPDRPGAHIRGPIRFDGAVFTSNARFVGVTFCGPALFDGARFEAAANFGGSSFENHADFDSVVFEADASFRRVTFADHAGFEATQFRGAAAFAGATFRSYVDVERAVFHEDANFNSATFQLARQLGPLVAHERLMVDDCVFAERAYVDVAARIVSGRSTTFAAGIHLRVRRGDVALDGADFGRPSLITAVPSWPEYSDLEGIDRSMHGEHVIPRLVAVRGAQVDGLTLSGLDLRACRFYGASSLQSLSIESTCVWPRTPDSWRWIDRETVAEEHDHRAWTANDEALMAPGWLTAQEPLVTLPAEQVAALYRALRKAREDSKDQAGANDLYYGEMSMRRRGEIPRRGERGRARARGDQWVLNAYWLLSGYGLKASRAMTAWIVLVAAASIAFYLCGFVAAPPYKRALLFAVESTAGIIRAPTTRGLTLTYGGEVLQLVLRLVGPLLIALTLLAIRARVKR